MFKTIWCFFIFVSAITAMSLWVSFSMDLRLVVLPVIPFAFVYNIFMYWSWLLLFALFLFLLLLLFFGGGGFVRLDGYCFVLVDLLCWGGNSFLVWMGFPFFGSVGAGGPLS